MKKGFLLVLFVFLSGTLFAQAEFFQGTDLGSSARMIRMANVEGFSQLSSTIFDNPAGVLSVPNPRHVSVFYSQLMQEVEYKNVAGIYKTPFGVFGVGMMLTEVPGLLVTTQDLFVDADNPPIIPTGETFSYSNGVMKLTYGFSQSEYLHFGLSGSYYWTQIHTYSGKGFNLDAGLLYDTSVFGMSLVLRNLASGLKVTYSNGGSETLSLQTVAGARYRFLPDLNLFGQVKVIGGGRKIANSVAAVYTPAFLPYITVSGGYKEFLVLRDIKGGLTMGFGLTLGGISADYAFEKSDHPEFNGKHYFSMGFAF